MRYVRTSLFAVALVAGAVSLSAQAGQQTPPANQPKTEQKADPKAPIAGKWNMSVEVPQQGAMASVLLLKQDGKKLTGTLTGPQGEVPVEGEYADGKISFAMSFQGSNGSMSIGFSGALKENGTLAGTLDFGQGQPLNWTAERAKEK